MAIELYFSGLGARGLANLNSAQRRELVLAKADLVRSSGPWIAFPDREPVFDAIDAGAGIGYNASPLFGLLHHPAAWNGKFQEPTFAECFTAIKNFAQRNRRLEARWPSLSTPREMLRAYIAENVIEQFADQTAVLQEMCRDIVRQKARQVPGLEAGIEFQGPQMLVEFPTPCANFIERLFSLGILADRDDSGAASFHLPLNLNSTDFEFLIDRIAAIWESPGRTGTLSMRLEEDRATWRDNQPLFEFHAHLLAFKLARAAEKPISLLAELDFVHHMLPPSLLAAEVVYVSAENWSQFRRHVAEMQTQVYEPSRQTAIEKFDALIDDPYGFGLLVMMKDELAGMVFVGPLELFPDERGTMDDPYRTDRSTMYTLDLTIASEYRGTLGRILKQAITLMLVAAGHNAIHGRNRDRLAGGMWAINLGLGSYELKRLVDDYPDQNQYRDCIYYRCPLRWPSAVEFEQINFADPSCHQALARVINA